MGRLVAKNQAVMVMDLQYSYDTHFWADLPVLQGILSGENEALDMSASGVQRDRDVSFRKTTALATTITPLGIDLTRASPVVLHPRRRRLVRLVGGCP